MRKRWLAGPLQSALAALPVVVVTGARQTGKTTLALALPEPRTFLSRSHAIRSHAETRRSRRENSIWALAGRRRSITESLPGIAGSWRPISLLQPFSPCSPRLRVRFYRMVTARQDVFQNPHPTPRNAVTTLPRRSVAVVGPAVRD